jgi:eukaryotic-like serine/threonine-protein kinase
MQVLPKQPGDPRRLGPYELVGRLGEGGMGVVYLGRERRGGRLAAVKALRPELAGDPAFAGRFRREVDAARRVDSRHVARVLDADPAADRPWLATEHVDGATLANVVAISGPLTDERLVAFAAGVAEALTAIHGAGVVHRDLKPSNVLLQHHEAAAALAATAPLAQGTPSPSRPTRPHPGLAGVKVIDFGIAWAADATRTRSGLRLGTPSWMAPEQLRDQAAGPPADVFAWGALVTFAATGRHPFGGGPAEAVAYRVLHDPPDLRGVPRPLRDLVERALSRDPSARPAAPQLVAALAALATPTLPLPATGPTLVLPVAAASAEVAGPTRRLRRRRVGRLLAAAALLAGLATTPQVVLAAVTGPDDEPGRQAAKHCPDDRQDREDTAEAARDHEPEDEPEPEDEDGNEHDGAGEGAGADAGTTSGWLAPAPTPTPTPTPTSTPTSAPPPGTPHPHAPDAGAPAREGNPQPEAPRGAVHSPPSSTPTLVPVPTTTVPPAAGGEVLGS